MRQIAFEGIVVMPLSSFCDLESHAMRERFYLEIDDSLFLSFALDNSARYSTSSSASAVHKMLAALFMLFTQTNP
jgi:hypothetical protein